MGGKNHQPCSIYLAESTKLSRFLSLAYAELELGNVALEDLILVELDDRIGGIVPIIERLDLSMEALRGASEIIAAIGVKMNIKGYTDLPSLKKVDLQTLGESLSERGLIDSASWNAVAKTMKKRGFRELLILFDGSIRALHMKTNSLRKKISELKGPVQKGEVHCILEENRSGNIKSEFSALYTAWMTFSQTFLASSLMSTELWYAFNGFDSLARKDARFHAA